MYHYITLSIAKAYIDETLNIYQALDYLLDATHESKLKDAVLDLICVLDQMNPDHKNALIESFQLQALPTHCWKPWKAAYLELLKCLSPLAATFQARSRKIDIQKEQTNVPVNLRSA